MGFFHTIFYEPIFNGLILLHRILPGHDLGVAIIGVTILIRLILIWPSIAQIKSTQGLQELRPRLKSLQEKYKNDRQELARQTMALYREHKVNPLSSCLPLLIQLPFLFALYQVFIAGMKTDPTTGVLLEQQLNDLYPALREIYTTTPLNTQSLGFLDLAAKGSIILAVLVGITQFFQAKMLVPPSAPPKVPGAKDEQMATMMTKQTTYIFPLVFAWVTYTLPSALGLYFLASNAFSIIQQKLILKRRIGPEENVQHEAQK